jgi:hypothetical protein
MNVVDEFLYNIRGIEWGSVDRGKKDNILDR